MSRVTGVRGERHRIRLDLFIDGRSRHLVPSRRDLAENRCDIAEKQ
jgi:hypothetical protein